MTRASSKRTLAVVEPEQVDLVVARHALARRREGQAGVAHVVLVAGHQRQRAAHQPQPVLARGLRQEGLDRPSPGVSRNASLSVSCRPIRQKYSGSTASSQPWAAACPIRRRAAARLSSSRVPDTICSAATFIGRPPWPRRRGRRGAPASARRGRRDSLVTRGSAQLPSMWNCCVAARASGSRRNTCARKVPRPIAGLMAAATSEAVPALISGTTTTRMSWVSRARSALPSISTAALVPFICRLLVAATPCWMADVAAQEVEGEALAEDVAEVQRQPPRQRLQAQHAEQLGQARVGLEELPAPHVHVEAALQRRVVEGQRRADPGDLAFHAAVGRAAPRPSCRSG